MHYKTRHLEVVADELAHGGQYLRKGDRFFATPTDADYYVLRKKAADLPSEELPAGQLAETLQPPPPTDGVSASAVADGATADAGGDATASGQPGVAEPTSVAMRLVPHRVAVLARHIGTALRTKAAVPWMTVQNTWGLVREPFAGAWQRNVVADNRECVLAFAAVYACVTRIASDIAKLRIKLVEVGEDGIWREAASNSPHWLVLRKPNRYQNRIQFLMDWLLMKLLYGNAYILKERDARNMVAAMYVLDSRRVRPVVTADGGVYYQLSSDMLAQLPNGALVPASEIIHDRGPTLWHPLAGVSPIYACGSSATQGNRIQANSAKFFENMSRPGGALSVPGEMDDPSFERMKREWNENFSGAGVGRTAVLTNGTKYEPFAIPAQDAQLIEQLQWTVEDVARAFAMPLYKIGAGAVPTSDNVEALQQQYYTDCLQVLIESLELCLDEGLGLPANLGAELDLDGLLRMDSATQITMLAEAVKGALMKPDEARARMNLPGVPGGDAVYLQQQNYSLAALAKRDAKEDPFATAKPPAPPAPAPAPDAAPVAPAPASPAKAADERQADQLAAAFILRLKSAEVSLDG